MVTANVKYLTSSDPSFYIKKPCSKVQTIIEVNPSDKKICHALVFYMLGYQMINDEKEVLQEIILLL